MELSLLVSQKKEEGIINILYFLIRLSPRVDAKSTSRLSYFRTFLHIASSPPTFWIQSIAPRTQGTPKSGNENCSVLRAPVQICHASQ
jgi:hypothetical protein